MKKNIFGLFIITFLFFNEILHSQNLKLKSKVELGNWQMTSKAMKSETFLSGALVKLYKGDKMISGVSSDADGNFEIEIPANGEYTLMIEYSGREPKKFVVNAKTISPDKDDANFKPSVDIVGVLMSKPKKGMESIGLNHPTVSFDQQTKTNHHHLRTNIYDGEYKLIQKFCTANKLGDMALENKNYSLAKTFYLMAMDMLETEDYPKTQLKKAEDGMRLEKVSKKKQKTKHHKTKSAITNQKPVSSPVKNFGTTKSSVETGKPTRKTPKPLGK